MLRFCYHLTTVGCECDQKHKSPMSIETLEDVLRSGVTVSKYTETVCNEKEKKFV